MTRDFPMTVLLQGKNGTGTLYVPPNDSVEEHIAGFLRMVGADIIGENPTDLRLAIFRAVPIDLTAEDKEDIRQGLNAASLGDDTGDLVN